jgi:polyisoprenoid-binding protein YceI
MSWLIDQAATRIGFSVKHMLVASVRGEFKRYSATNLHIDPDDFVRSTFAGEIELDSLDTGNAERDGLVRQHQVLGDASHPKLTFASTNIAAKGKQEYRVSGLLRMRGIEKPVTLDVTYGGTTRAPDGKLTAQLRVRGSLSRKAFGVSLGVMEVGGLSVGDTVNIELDVRAVRDGTSA